ncbi:protein ALWAYS EARLY 3 isoform X1 [Amborella trichopoda]|nr:protein ALWAYS EARLY 3 isoform X1 [Amborella trichopoda]XP_020518489.1 protein ALWAYS EARLY 3 isoform X1 [Amborella trichopoda]XP_020518490.1 protein ALWAYS EARLY 3 isoform X1 [Amborella trichopoda]|eukprot:XP_011620753.1 protein ALWAYS EARLY 3 isoform X1 [Amborella trichopoda]
MASTRKSKAANRRSSKVHEEPFDKDGVSPNKSNSRKRKFEDIGPQWSKEELECFYDAYRKFGKDWKKVAGAIRNRSIDMVHALYRMNKAYLSLSEGHVSGAGLIALMTDHYNLMEASDSDRESNEGVGMSRKPHKRARGKPRVGMSKDMDQPFPDLSKNPAISSQYGCLSLLKRRRSGGSRPRAVGKRTPRFPVSYLYDKDNKAKVMAPKKQEFDSEVDPDEDEVAQVALTLAEASQRGGSPQVSRTPSKRAEHTGQIPFQNGDRKYMEAGFVGGMRNTAVDEGCVEGSLGSREADNGESARPRNHRSHLDVESVDAKQASPKMKRMLGKKLKAQGIEYNHVDDIKEECSCTDEGLNPRADNEEIDMEAAIGKSEKSSPPVVKKRSRQLISGDECSAIDALQTLADLSLTCLLPSSIVESESSVQVKEENGSTDNVDKPYVQEHVPPKSQRQKSRSVVHKEKRTSSQGAETVARDNAKLGKEKSANAIISTDKSPRFRLSIDNMRKGKRKSLTGNVKPKPSKVDSELHSKDSQKAEGSIGEVKKSATKAKRVSQIGAVPKLGKSTKPPERSSSNIDVGKVDAHFTASAAQIATMNQVSLPTKLRSRRKMDLPKTLVKKDLKSSDTSGHFAGNELGTVNIKAPNNLHSHQDRVAEVKNALVHCLSSPKLRRWCTYEWFYSAIDYPWFAQSEFVEYLNHVRLGHVPRLTRVEWGVIRSSLGKTRRLSKRFLQEEREKLEKYRESVRKHYSDLRNGLREGLPADFPRPLSVGQRVIACHPKTREIHDGSILTIDGNRCRVQFDRPELGVEFVLDIDCMPLNQLENMPDALKRKNHEVSNFREDLNDIKLDVKPKEWKVGEQLGPVPSEKLDNATDGPFFVAFPDHSMNTLFMQARGDTVDAVMQAKAAANEVSFAAHQGMYNQPSSLSQIQAREADIKALAELTRALDKKEAILIELRHMNNEFGDNIKNTDLAKHSEQFKKQYAMLLVQLNGANDQVEKALITLRQRNTYQDTSLPPSYRSVTNTVGPGSGGLSITNQSAPISLDSTSHVAEIVESSRRKARALVDAAMQVVPSLKEGNNPFDRMGEALDLANHENCTGDSSLPAMQSSIPPPDSTNQPSAPPPQDHGVVPCKTDPETICLPEPKREIDFSEANEAQLPSELISSCVATLLMIQTCTERQYPPAEVAQILDDAVRSLQPCSPQNLGIYREIQQLMGIVKNQILALVPTQQNVPLSSGTGLSSA